MEHKRDLAQKHKKDSKVEKSHSSSKKVIVKKNGGGGKYTEGRVGDELNYVTVHDRGDPLYDSENEDNIYFEVDGGNNVIYIEDEKDEDEQVLPPPETGLTLFKQKVDAIIEEYFQSADAEEARRCLEELNAPTFHYEFVKRCVTKSLDKRTRERELASELLSCLYGSTLTQTQIEKGFERVLENLEELYLDVPKSPRYIAQFIARAVVDEIIPPAFLTDEYIESIGSYIVDAARVFLSRKHGYLILERIWGPGDGRSVKDLKVNVRQLLDEFIVSYDFAEAERCVRELEAPNFMHEVVKSAIILVMEHPENFGRVSDLLQYLHSVQVISDKQLLKGFIRVNQRLSDIVLDSPRAEEIFNDFVNHAKTNGCLNQDTDFSAESSQPKALDSEIDQTAE